jgi:hypothetical protein
MDTGDEDASPAVSIGSNSAPEVHAAVAEEQGTGGQHEGGGVLDAVLLLMMRTVLAGVQGLIVLEWLVTRITEALVWAVELGLLLVQSPN